VRAAVAALVAVSLLVLGITSPAAARTSAPVGYSPSAHGAEVDLLPLDVSAGVRGTWRLAVAFRCKDQEVVGAVVAHVDRHGRFEVTTDALTTQADYGSDTDTTIRGRLGDDGARGTIDSYARAYDNDGTTAECERDGIPWRADAIARPELDRVVAYVPAPHATVFAASRDALFFGNDDGDRSGEVWRVDTADAGGRVKWRAKVGTVSDLIVDGDRLWIADSGRGRLIALDARTGKQLVSTKVAQARFEGISQQPLAVTPDAVLVGTNKGIVRVDPQSGAVLGTLAIGTVVAVAAGPAGIFAVKTRVDADGRYVDATILRVDEATGSVLVEHPIASTSVNLAVLDNAVAVAIVYDPVELLDPATLANRATSTEKGDDSVAAAVPGVWVSSSDSADPVVSVAAVDASGATIDKIPGISGTLTTAPGAVWVLDTDAAGALEIRAG
jgi:hypothetical protein